MRMHFERNESGETLVHLVLDGKQIPFDYITLVKHLIETPLLEQSTFAESFSSEERSSVDSMVEALMTACMKPEELKPRETDKGPAPEM